ncbi:MAG TPA: hypothetical protein VL728_12000 [Cyclobacteriaceae bacterium]|jgi:hypothetical protein|nr:hypothetical protein [Cyclobacteriaceae bacterium]
MKNKKKLPKPNLPTDAASDGVAPKFPGYPLYSANEDIYNKFKEEERMDPEDPSKTKTLNETDEERRNEEELNEDISSDGLDIPISELDSERKSAGGEDEEKNNEKDFNDDVSGGDLDVPGSELDDQQESVGSEDEENNYYSLGGDNHNDLEESKEE